MAKNTSHSNWISGPKVRGGRLIPSERTFESTRDWDINDLSEEPSQRGRGVPEFVSTPSGYEAAVFSETETVDPDGNAIMTGGPVRLAKIKQSLLRKKMFLPDDGTGRNCPDSRDQVWKIWSRIFEGMQEDTDKGIQTIWVSLKEIVKDFKKARHFVLPTSAETWDMETFYSSIRTVRGIQMDDDEWNETIRSMFHTFIMPFDICAMHLPGESIAIISKLYDEDSGTASGIAGNWSFYLLYPNREPLPGDVPDFNKSDNTYLTSYVISHSSLCMGMITIDDDALEKSIEDDSTIPFSVTPMLRWDLMSNGHVIQAWHVKQDAEGDSEDERERSVKSLATNPVNELGEGAQLSFDLLHAIQSHKRFIVEIAPNGKKKKKKKRKAKASILPISQSPVYISLEPKEIRETLGLPAPEANGGKHAPHERRAHLRQLRSERFTWKRGQIIPVKGSWIGPTSGTTNEGREYRVLIGKTSPHVAGARKGEG